VTAIPIAHFEDRIDWADFARPDNGLIRNSRFEIPAQAVRQ